MVESLQDTTNTESKGYSISCSWKFLIGFRNECKNVQF